MWDGGAGEKGGSEEGWGGGRGRETIVTLLHVLTLKVLPQVTCHYTYIILLHYM